MQQELPILTPEKTILSYRLAGLGSRVTAHLLDLAIFVVMAILAIVALTYGARIVDEGLTQGIALVLFSLGPFAYFILFEGLWNGQTPGKKAAGIRVRMVDGTPVAFGAALGRNLLRPADMLPGPYLLGIVAMFLNPRAQRIGDLVANTVVVHERRPINQFNTAPHLVGIHPYEHEVGELRGMTREEYDALRRFCDRYPELSAATQARLLQELWEPIADRRKVPPLPNVHPLYLAEAAVMKYGRQHGLL
ncbi:MAG: RDD family protein [Fimbriimonas sp.]